MSRVLGKGKNRVTQGFKRTHGGVDLGKNYATVPIIAHSGGTVVSCVTGQKNNKGSSGTASYGNYVKLDHGDGYETLYAHLDTVKVQRGQHVVCGEVIGTMGNTGNSYGAHLHFEVRKNGERIDPSPYLSNDLPLTERVDVRYRVCVGGRWLPWVTNCGEGSSGYAGVFSKDIWAVQVKPARGIVTFRVHEKGVGWLPWVENGKANAGVGGKPIDDLQAVYSDGEYTIRYRVTSPKTDDWHGWCEGLTDKTGDGYAGVFGYPIDGVQMEIVRKRT